MPEGSGLPGILLALFLRESHRVAKPKENAAEAFADSILYLERKNTMATEGVFGFFIPTVNLTGIGSHKEIANRIKILGCEKPFICTDKGIVASGIAEKVVTLIKEGLGVDPVVLDRACCHRPKCIKANLKLHLSEPHAIVDESVDDSLCEVQRRSRCRRRSKSRRKHRLVAIRAVEMPMEVRRKRHFPNLTDHFLDVTVRIEGDRYYPVGGITQDCHLDGSGDQLDAPTYASCGAYQRLPATIVNPSGQQHLNLPTGIGPMCPQPCRPHPCLVDHKKIARPEHRGKLSEHDRSEGISQKESRGISWLDRTLCDQFWR